MLRSTIHAVRRLSSFQLKTKRFFSPSCRGCHNRTPLFSLSAFGTLHTAPSASFFSTTTSSLVCYDNSSLGTNSTSSIHSNAQTAAVDSDNDDDDTTTDISSNLDSVDAIEMALNSVVKIFTVSSSPNYFLPWQNLYQRETTGSGFVITGKMILTNAHVVAHNTFVLVRKHGSPTKYRAQVKAVGNECDLAILTVESEEFWEGMTSLELSGIPFLQEAVAVVGYPEGGDTISVTKGIVSRVEPTEYAHGETQLMTIQIDAAINSGNSGGPALMGNKVAGVAFQNLENAENIGYIIPVPVIEYFISCVESCGGYVGFCSMGLSYQLTENAQLREHFGMKSDMTGVLVNKINSISDAYKILKQDDILLKFDGVPIANDGTVPFRNRERITFNHLVSMKRPNETAQVRVLRNGEEKEFSIRLHPLQQLVPAQQYNELPSYFIFAGLVFIPLTQAYLHAFGKDWIDDSPRRLCELALKKHPKNADQQFVILCQVLMDDINVGYEGLSDMQVFKVNGVVIQNLKHIRKLVDECTKDNLRFDLDDEKVIALNYESAKLATSRILKRYRIPSAMSEDLCLQNVSN